MHKQDLQKELIKLIDEAHSLKATGVMHLPSLMAIGYTARELLKETLNPTKG